MKNCYSSLFSGAWRFGLLGFLAFSVWKAPFKLGTVALYSSITAVFVIGSGLLLYPLFKSENRITTCYKIFLPGFIVYALLWCAGWFGIRESAGELFGSAAGLAVFAWIIHQFYFKSTSKQILVSWSILFLFHTLGYTLGSMFYYSTYGRGVFASFMEGHQTIGGLLWGLFYGIGFGTGLGAVLSED